MGDRVLGVERGQCNLGEYVRVEFAEGLMYGMVRKAVHGK